MLGLLTSFVEKKPLLSRLSIGSLSGSKESSGDHQMMPELLNETFLAKATQHKPENTVKNRMMAGFPRKTR